MRVEKSPLAIKREAEQNGYLVSTYKGLVHRNDKPEVKWLKNYFLFKLSKYDAVFDEDDGETVMNNINEYIEENNIDIQPLDYPLSSGTDMSLIPITDNLQLVVDVTDEYYGSGDYSRYVKISEFIINDKTRTEDIDKLVEFIHEYLHR